MNKEKALLQAKAITSTEKVNNEDINFQVLNEPRSKLLHFSSKDIRVRGYLFEFKITLPVPLLKIAYLAGFGEKNSQGFGLVKELL